MHFHGGGTTIDGSPFFKIFLLNSEETYYRDTEMMDKTSEDVYLKAIDREA